MKPNATPPPLPGQKYGRWTIIGDAPSSKSHRYVYAECACGTKKKVRYGDLTRGMSESCGCLAKERVAASNRKRVTHGMTGTRLHRIWHGMLQRCYYEGHKWYHRYGGRKPPLTPIRVCEEWRKSFQVFHDWAAVNGYEPHLTLDRSDNDGNYCPENCRWVTVAENNRNRSFA